MTTSRRHPCAHCPDTFGNHIARTQHVRKHHPEVKRAPVYPMVPPRGPRGDTLKRESDRWPGRP